MDRLLSTKLIKAKKKYRCDASEQWRRSGYSIDDCDTVEQKQIVETAEDESWFILPGQMYLKMVGIHDGEFCSYRARPEMDLVCHQMDMWSE